MDRYRPLRQAPGKDLSDRGDGAGHGRAFRFERILPSSCSGGRGYEEALLDQWAFEYPRVKSVAGKYSLDQELALISRLDLLICMDSANMHFASLVGTRVLSVWGRYPSLCRILRISSGSGRLYPVGLTLPSLFRIRPKACLRKIGRV